MLFKIITSILIAISSTILAQDDFTDSDDNTQNIVTITGVITDASSGNPIAGANVLVDDGDVGSAADQDGVYTIEGVESGASVTVTAIGYNDLTLYADQEKIRFCS